MSRPRISVERHDVLRLAPSTWDELWAFASQYTDGSRAAFEASLRAKTRVVILREPATRAVVGLGGIQLYPLEHEGQRILVLFTGNLVFAPEVRGQSIVQREGFRAFVEARLRHPLTPIWLFYDTFSFRSYMMLPANFREFWPRHDRPTPPAILALLERLGQQRYGADWDSARGLCRRGERRLKEGVATVTESMLVNPHVRYFTGRNPGYAEGDMLAVLIPLTLGNWASVAARTLSRVSRRRARGESPGARAG